jgi:hypothetical protein
LLLVAVVVQVETPRPTAMEVEAVVECYKVLHLLLHRPIILRLETVVQQEPNQPPHQAATAETAVHLV